MNINTATAQEVFDHIVSGLAGQGFTQSLDWDAKCAYRGEGGVKCAAGHVIPDGDYRSSMEGKPWGGPRGVATMLDFSRHVDLIGQCQAAHDFGVTALRMKMGLRAVADDTGLDIPEVLKEA